MIKIKRPDDFHVHLRAGDMLKAVAKYTAAQFGRALVMPNVPPITTAEHVHKYRNAINSLGTGLVPLMTVMVNSETTPEAIIGAHEAGAVAAKIYPANVTTGSESGVTNFEKLGPIYETLERLGMVLCWHPEMPGQFCLERERSMLHIIGGVVRAHPRLRMVLEHITSSETVYWMSHQPDRIAATITVHHLMMTLDDVIGGGTIGTQGKLYPDHYCAPIAKHPRDRDTLVIAATSRDTRFFLGTDSAPHPRSVKLGSADSVESCCGAGVFSAPVAMQALASVFERAGKLDALESFASINGAKFYGLPQNESTMTLVKEPWVVPRVIEQGVGGLAPFMAGKTLDWQIRD